MQLSIILTADHSVNRLCSKLQQRWVWSMCVSFCWMRQEIFFSLWVVWLPNTEQVYIELSVMHICFLLCILRWLTCLRQQQPLRHWENEWKSIIHDAIRDALEGKRDYCGEQQWFNILALIRFVVLKYFPLVLWNLEEHVLPIEIMFSSVKI